jgi:DNA-binding response OmpR family regulator
MQNPSQHILLVEDDFYARELNSRVLTGSGYDVEGTGDGAAGWEATSWHQIGWQI